MDDVAISSHGPHERHRRRKAEERRRVVREGRVVRGRHVQRALDDEPERSRDGRREHHTTDAIAVRVRGLELARGQPGGHPEHREAGRRRDAVAERPQVRAREAWHLFERVRGELAAQLAGEALTPEDCDVEPNLQSVGVVEARVEMRASSRRRA